MTPAWKHRRETRKVVYVEPAGGDDADGFPPSGPRTGPHARVLERDTSPQLPLAEDYMSKVPAVSVPTDWIKLTRIDHRAGYLLSRIDGKIDVETLIDVSCMPCEETLALLEQLVGLGLVTVR